MNSLRRVLAGTAIAAVGLGALTAATAAPAAAAPLNVRIVTFDGKKTMQVKRKLTFLVSCSKDCGVKVKIKLITPAAVTPGSLSGSLSANAPRSAGFRLNNYGLRYLRQNYRSSRFSVKVTAKDLETGKSVVKRKVFRFRK